MDAIFLEYIDIRTSLLLLTIGELVSILLLVAYKKSITGDRAYLLFIAGKFCLAFAWPLYGMRGDIPDILSIQVANVIALAGFSLQSVGLITVGRDDRQVERLYLLLFLLTTGSFLLFGEGEKDRLILFSLSALILFGICGILLCMRMAGSRIRLFIGILCLPAIPIGLARAIAAFQAGPGEYSLFTANLINSSGTFLLFFMMFVSGIGFLLILKELDDERLYLSLEELKRLNAALKESEEYKRVLVENLPDYIIVYDMDQEIRYINPAVTTTLGYSPEEVIGTPILPHVAAEDRDLAIQQIRARLMGENPLPIEISILSKDGQRHPVIIKGRLISYEGRIATLLLLNDISAQKASQQLLRENEEKFTTIFKQTPDPILILSREGRIIDLNQGFRQVFGDPPGEREKEGDEPEGDGGPRLDLMDTGLTCTMIRDLLARTAEGKTAHGELILHRADGGPFVADVAISRIQIRSEPCLLIAIHDMDEIYRANKAVAEVNRKLQILSSVTRHDILNRIMITAFHLGEIRQASSSPEQVRSLDILDQVTGEIKNLIQFTGQYQELGSSAPDWQNIDRLLDTPQVQGLIGETDLFREINRLEVYADPMFGRVIFNLVENSVRHGQNLTRISLTCRRDGGDLVIVYEDNGGGIAAGEKDKIFRKGVGKNTGLGLFLIREILEITGITIRETGEPGVGARFEIRVPPGKFRFPEADR